MNRLNRSELKFLPLSERYSKLSVADTMVDPSAPPLAIDSDSKGRVDRLVERIRAAREAGKPVILTYGAHLVKNGLGPVVIEMMKRGWITHVATNGAGSIHDWEFAFLGRTSEDVRDNAAMGQFGIWEETGRYINAAIVLGGLCGLGYGWSVGKLISEEELSAPSTDELLGRITDLAQSSAPCEEIAALSDALCMLEPGTIPPGDMKVPHPNKAISIQCVAYELGVPFTVHPGVGYDIIYTHPANIGGAIGRGAVSDFLSYADSVSKLDGGVHMAVGSAIMAPMIFEKSLSMANNLSIQRTGKPLTDHYMAVVDIQEGGGWDWSKGEPPMDNPAYYLRFCKSFYRMGGTLDYICCDNRAFLTNLAAQLR